MKKEGVLMACPVCNGNNTFEYYRVENMPIFLFAVDRKYADEVKAHTFIARLCRNCLLGFNASPLDLSELSQIYEEYDYISPMFGIGREKSKNISKTVIKHCNIEDKIVEIGCYDGYLLYTLKEKGYKNLLGIEPSKAADIAVEKGINVIKDFFSEKINIPFKVDCFILSHVFEHLPSPIQTLKVLKSFLSEKGKIIIEVPYMDGYHHQHLYFFSIGSVKRLCDIVGLSIADAEIDTYFEQGPVIRVVITHSKNEPYNNPFHIETLEEIEKMAYEKFNAYKIKIQKLKNIISKNKRIYWWGAGSSSVIFLNALKDYLNEVNAEVIVIDGDPNKWGKCIPSIGLEVRSYKEFSDKELSMVIIASQFYREIINTLEINRIHVNSMEVVY